MSRDLDDLDPEFGYCVRQLLERCAERNVIMRPFFTKRDVYLQARLWRQSRSSQQVLNAIKTLDRAKAPFLASVLQRVGPQHGKWATNALPGQSWHQWGQALDCFVLDGNEAVWDDEHSSYEVYAYEATQLGMTAGLYWTSRDAVHVQGPKMSAPGMAWQEIDREMRALYSHLGLGL